MQHLRIEDGSTRGNECLHIGRWILLKKSIEITLALVCYSMPAPLEPCHIVFRIEMVCPEEFQKGFLLFIEIQNLTVS